MDFLTPKEVSQLFKISLSTIYYRIKNKTYRTGRNGKILLADVVESIDNPPKTGRPRKENGGV